MKERSSALFCSHPALDAGSVVAPFSSLYRFRVYARDDCIKKSVRNPSRIGLTLINRKEVEPMEFIVGKELWRS